jgi:hypothetical protein
VGRCISGVIAVPSPSCCSDHTTELQAKGGVIEKASDGLYRVGIVRLSHIARVPHPNLSYVYIIIHGKAVILPLILFLPKGKKGKSISVTGRGGPQDCETSKFPHFLDNRLTDGGKVVSRRRRLPVTPQEDTWY